MDFNKPRIGVYYYVVPQTGMRNDGPPLFANANLRLLLNGKFDMDSDTGNVVHLWPGRADHGTFDLNLLVDHGEDAIGVPLDWEIPHPSAYWVSDAHLGYDYRLERAKQMDFVFCCQRRAMELFIRDGVDPAKCFYLPHAFEPTCYKPYPIIEKWDWCFIGHPNNEFRINLLDRFTKEFPPEKWYLGWRFGHVLGHNVLDDVARKFSQSRIVLNEAIQDDLNMRVFEALGCKRLLLTEDIPAIHEFFESGTHLLTFKTIDEAVERAKFILDRPELRQLIAQQGYDEAIKKHTYKHRMETILKTALNYTPEPMEGLVTC